jgi:hypothetical protein
MTFHSLDLVWGYRISEKKFKKYVGFGFKSIKKELSKKEIKKYKSMSKEDKEEFISDWWEPYKYKNTTLDETAFVIKVFPHDVYEEEKHNYLIIGIPCGVWKQGPVIVKHDDCCDMTEESLSKLEDHPIWPFIKKESPQLYAIADDCWCCS